MGLGVLPNATILFSSIITSSVYLHSLRFAGLFSRRLCLGCHFLSLWFFLSERLGLGLGFRPQRDIMDFLSSFITSPPSIFTLYASPVDSHGPLCLGAHFLSYCYSFTFFIISHFSLIFYKIEPFFPSSPYFTFRISNVIRTGPHDTLLFVVL